MAATTPPLIRGLQRVREWAKARPDAVDVGFAALIALVTLIDAAATPEARGYESFDATALLLVLTGSVALIWRRRAPVTVAVVASAVMAAYWIAGYSSFLSTLGLPALYSLVVYGRDRRKTWAVFTFLGLALFLVACLTVLDPDPGFEQFNAASMLVYLAGTGVVAVLIRNRQQIFVDTQRRAEQAEADRRAEAERAVARERLRIAREMHDVVAHGMSVVAVQAAAAQEVVHADPDKAAEALGRIEAVSRESLTEMRRMLGVLRNTDEPGLSLTPQPTLGDVEAAVTQATEAGVAADLVVQGAPRSLPPGIELAAFRITQEALTNVRKHAGPRATATVTVDYGDHAVSVSVVDDGRGAVSGIADSGGGNGLIGMRERVEAYGGEFSAGPTTGGGYSVTAVLPVDDAVRRPSVSAVEPAISEGSP